MRASISNFALAGGDPYPFCDSLVVGKVPGTLWSGSACVYHRAVSQNYGCLLLRSTRKLGSSGTFLVWLWGPSDNCVQEDLFTSGKLLAVPISRNQETAKIGKGRDHITLCPCPTPTRHPNEMQFHAWASGAPVDGKVRFVAILSSAWCFARHSIKRCSRVQGQVYLFHMGQYCLMVANHLRFGKGLAR